MGERTPAVLAVSDSGCLGLARAESRRQRSRRHLRRRAARLRRSRSRSSPAPCSPFTRPTRPSRSRSGRDWKGKLSIAAYAVAIAAAAWVPWFSTAVYVGVACVWLVPDRRIERVGPVEVRDSDVLALAAWRRARSPLRASPARGRRAVPASGTSQPNASARRTIMLKSAQTVAASRSAASETPAARTASASAGSSSSGRSVIFSRKTSVAASSGRTGAVRQSASIASQTSLPSAYDATAPWEPVQKWHWFSSEVNPANSSRSPSLQSDGPRIAVSSGRRTACRRAPAGT